MYNVQKNTGKIFEFIQGMERSLQITSTFLCKDFVPNLFICISFYLLNLEKLVLRKFTSGEKKRNHILCPPGIRDTWNLLSYLVFFPLTDFSCFRSFLCLRGIFSSKFLIGYMFPIHPGCNQIEL